MTRTKRLGLIGITAATVIGVPFLCARAKSKHQTEALNEQLRLARRDGIPTNAEQFKALIPIPSPEENAAPFYSAMERTKVKRVDWMSLERRLIESGGKDAGAAQQALTSFHSDLLLAEQASEKRKCWFNRDWSEGEATLFPEYAKIKATARALSVRGLINALSGNSAAALKDAKRILTMALHVGQEPHSLAYALQIDLYSIGLSALATWSVLRHRQHAYFATFSDAVRHYPSFNAQRIKAMELFGRLSTIDLTQSPEGLKKLGLREDQLPEAEKVMPLLIDRIQAKARMVEAYRRYWNLLKNPKENASSLEEAEGQVAAHMIAFPAASSIYGMLSEDLSVNQLRRSHESSRLGFVAIELALGRNQIPRDLRLSGLRSPYDGKPVHFTFDGKQVKVAISGGNEIVIPPQAR